MSAQQYVRVDLWRYIKVKDEDIRSSFKFTVFIVNYIFYFILLLSVITVILANINIKVNLLINFMVCIIISYIREGNVIGNTILDICACRCKYTYGLNLASEMYVYNTKKAHRVTRKSISFIYTFIFVLLIMLMLNMILHIGFTTKTSIVTFSIIFYAFVYWMHPKTIKRRLNLIFGI